MRDPPAAQAAEAGPDDRRGARDRHARAAFAAGLARASSPERLLDLDPARFPTPAARDTQLSALLSKAAREAPEKDIELVRAALNSEPAIARGARGLAIFASSDADVLEAVRLPSPS